MSVIVLGTVALDTVRTPYGERISMLGGSAVHFSMAARLFTDVHLVAVIGEDFPAGHISFLKKKGIKVSSVIRREGKSFQWEGEYKGDCNCAITINTQLGVLLDFEPVISEEERKIKNVFLANIDPDVQEGLLKKMRSVQLVALDSMNFWIENKRKALLKMLKKVDIYVANDQEARSLSGYSNIIKAAQYLKSLGPKVVMIKKGENGVMLYSDEFIFLLPAYPTARVVDPTGAGDTFAGGFMGYLARAGRVNASSFRQAVAYGTIAASFNVEGFGVERTAGLTVSKLDKRLESFRRTVSL